MAQRAVSEGFEVDPTHQRQEGVEVEQSYQQYEEKAVNIGEQYQSDVDEKEAPSGELDPFIPFEDEPGIPLETHAQILRVRAVLVGCCLGGLVNASNVYLGLFTPWLWSSRWSWISANEPNFIRA
jgi:hypothetical protein